MLILKELIEDGGYAALVAEHPEREAQARHSKVASLYGTFESLADLFRQIGLDERIHKQISLATMSRSDRRTPAV